MHKNGSRLAPKFVAVAHVRIMQPLKPPRDRASCLITALSRFSVEVAGSYCQLPRAALLERRPLRIPPRARSPPPRAKSRISLFLPLRVLVAAIGGASGPMDAWPRARYIPYTRG